MSPPLQTTRENLTTLWPSDGPTERNKGSDGSIACMKGVIGISVWVYGLGEFQGVRIRYQLYNTPHQVDKYRTKGSN